MDVEGRVGGERKLFLCEKHYLLQPPQDQDGLIGWLQGNLYTKDDGGHLSHPIG